MKYKLNEVNIDAACKEVNAYLLKKKTISKERIQTTLSIEEILLNYMDVFGKDTEFALDFGGGLSKTKIRLTVPGALVNPFPSIGDSSDEEQFLSNLLTRMGQRPKWKYARGTNTILYTPRRKSLPDWGKLLTPIIAGLVEEGSEQGIFNRRGL